MQIEKKIIKTLLCRCTKDKKGDVSRKYIEKYSTSLKCKLTHNVYTKTEYCQWSFMLVTLKKESSHFSECT